MTDPLPPDALRWRCDSASLPFETTDEVEPWRGVVGQEAAVDALRFGLETDAPGQNVYVRGLTGTGRMTLVAQTLEELRPTCHFRHDRLYVHDFARPDRPRLITLPRGGGVAFREAMEDLAEFVREGLPALLDADANKARREALQRTAQEEAAALTEPIEAELREAGLALVSLKAGNAVQMAIFPVVDGQPVPPEQLGALVAEERLSEEDVAALLERRDGFAPRMAEVERGARELQRRMARDVRQLVRDMVGEAMADAAAPIRSEFEGADVAAFLDDVTEDVVRRFLAPPDAPRPDPSDTYGVNLVLEHHDGDECPIVTETTPTLSNLLGTVERRWGAQGPLPSDYRMVRGGSLLRADGGYLVLDARDLLSEPGAWKVLVRTLRTGLLEIVPQEIAASPFFGQHITPEPIPVNVRVILVGDGMTYAVLDQRDPDFGHLFKVLADFDHELPREPDGAATYAGTIARLQRDEELPPYDREAVAALVEHGARIASRRGKLTARFGRVADIAREAALLARKDGARPVSGDDVRDAVARTKARADLPSRRFQDLIEQGTIHVCTRGEVVGQVNGLAVMQAGPLTYGFPARITATIGAGSAGIVDVEGSSSLSGRIHTKGFHILGGLLRHLLRTEHRLAFSASLAFEQSYGGIDGDSASGAEICCLLSALTGSPIDQGKAITGAIDQHGRIQAIGGVNEKVEGFYDVCAREGLTGDQGVIVPRSNAGDLMLRHDVVEACAEGRFSIWAVDRVEQALELLTGIPAGAPDEDGVYPEGTLLQTAQQRAHDFWALTFLAPVWGEEEGDGPAADDGEEPTPEPEA